MIFAVPMILQFVIEETQDFMGKCLLTICSLFLRRGNMYDYFRIYSLQNGRDNFTVKVEIVCWDLGLDFDHGLIIF